MNIEIANRLLEYRKQKGLSQEQLAAELGISRQAVSKWERAEASPDTDNLIALAKLYGVSLDELLGHQIVNKKDGNDEEYAHIGFDGIHVKEDEGNEVHVGWDGIHVSEKNGHKVDIDKNGIFVDNKEYKKEDFNHYKKEHKYHFPLTTLVVLGYIIYGASQKAWHPTWIIIFIAPILESIIQVIKKKKISKFNYVFFSIFIYLYMGFYMNLWHPSWVIFITIPCFYSFANYLDYLEKGDEKIE